MKINLKKLRYSSNTLDMAIAELKHNKRSRIVIHDLEIIYNLIEVIKEDLRMCGESIVELDMPRTPAIEEADGV